MGDRDDPDDVMKTSLTIDYDKQWLNCVSATGPISLCQCCTGGGGGPLKSHSIYESFVVVLMCFFSSSIAVKVKIQIKI